MQRDTLITGKKEMRNNTFKPSISSFELSFLSFEFLVWEALSATWHVNHRPMITRTARRRWEIILYCRLIDRRGMPKSELYYLLTTDHEKACFDGGIRVKLSDNINQFAPKIVQILKIVKVLNETLMWSSHILNGNWARQVNSWNGNMSKNSPNQVRDENKVKKTH